MLKIYLLRFKIFRSVKMMDLFFQTSKKSTVFNKVIHLQMLWTNLIILVALLFLQIILCKLQTEPILL